MDRELTPLEVSKELKDFIFKLELGNVDKLFVRGSFNIIEDALKECKNLEEENKSLTENNENLDENYFDTWYACQELKKNSDYALMFVDNVYCLVDTADNKFDIIETYTINDKGIIDNGTQKKLKALEIIKVKGIDINALRIHKHCKTPKRYNDQTSYFYHEELTQEEFNLLKEVLL